MKESEREYRHLFDNAVLGMYQSTMSGSITAANRALVNMLGYNSVEELASLNLATDVYMNSSDREAFWPISKQRDRTQMSN